MCGVRLNFTQTADDTREVRSSVSDSAPERRRVKLKTHERRASERLLKVYQSGHPSIGHKSFSISKHNLPLQATGCRKEKRKVTMGIVKFIKHELEEAEITKKTSDPCIARPPTKVNRRRTILP